MQGLTAAVPVPLIFASGTIVGDILELACGRRPGYTVACFSGFQGVFNALLTALFFALGVAVSFLPGLESGAGLVVLLGGIGLLGLSGFYAEAERGALNILGPFLGAGSIFALDWAVRAAG